MDANVLNAIVNSASEPLEKAQSLPFSAYTSEEVLEAERASIFSKEWVFVCMEGELRKAGDYFAIDLANEPIVILRGEDGELRALSNVCRHRGTIILDDGFGRVEKYLTCPYHAWAYDHDGALQAIPYNKVIAVDREAHGLKRLALDVWNGLVFVSLDEEAAPLRERLNGIDEFLRLFQPETFSYVSQGETEIWRTNWKLAMENAMESYHLFKVHETTLEVVSPTRDAYYIAGSSEWSLTGGATQRTEKATKGYNEFYGHYILVQLAPSFVGILSYGSFGWLSAHPIDAQTTQIRSGATLLKEAGAGRDAAFTKAFFKEDKDMCERVQKGMRSQLAKGGKLVDMEQVVVDFHQFLASRLTGGGATTPRIEHEAAALWREASRESV